MDIDEKAGGVVRRGRATIATRTGRVHRATAAVRKDAAAAIASWVADPGHVFDEVVGLRLGLLGRPTIGEAALGAAGAAIVGHDVPMEREIAVEVDAWLRAAAGSSRTEAVGAVGILAPGGSSLGLLAPIRVGLQHKAEIVVIDQPGGFRITAVVVDQPFRESRIEFSRRVLARVDGAEYDHFRPIRIVAGRRQISDAQGAHVVALRCILSLRPSGAEAVDRDDVWMVRDHRVHRLVGFLDGAEALIAWNAVGAGTGRARLLQRRIERTQLGGCSGVDADAQAGVLQRLDAAFVGVNTQGLAFGVDDHMLELGGRAGQRGCVRIVRFDYPFVGHGGIQADDNDRHSKQSSVHWIHPRIKRWILAGAGRREKR